MQLSAVSGSIVMAVIDRGGDTARVRGLKTLGPLQVYSESSMRALSRTACLHVFSEWSESTLKVFTPLQTYYPHLDQTWYATSRLSVTTYW